MARSSVIPTLTQANPDTYDLDRLLGTSKGARTGKPQTAVDFVQRNIKATKPMKPSTTFTAVLSYERLLTPRKTMKPQQSAQLFTRLVTYKRQNQAKAQETKQTLMEKEIRQCTFVPKVDKTAALRERRKPEDLYYSGLSQLKETQAKSELLREQLKPEPSTFHPSLDRHSLQLTQGRASPVFRKLYEAGRQRKADLQDKVRSRSAEERRPFVPALNKHSLAIAAAGPRPAAKKPTPPVQTTTSRTTANPASLRILQERFEADFTATWGLYSPTDCITASLVLRQLLKDLHLETTGQAESLTAALWASLEGGLRGGVKRKDVLLLLKVVMRMQVFPKAGGDSGKTGGIYGRFLGELYVLGPRDVQRLQRTFKGTYEQRRQLKKTQRSTSTHSEQNSSKGSRGSSRTASPLNSSVSMRMSVESQCTFHPDLSLTLRRTPSPTPASPSRHLALFALAKQSQARKAVTCTQQQTQTRTAATLKAQMTECSFAPKLNRRPS